MRLILIIFLLTSFFINQNIAQKTVGEFANDTIIVYIFMLEDCVICQNYSLALREMHKKYSSEQIQFVGLFPNKFSHPKTIAQYKEKYDIPFELKMDYYKTRTKKMGAEVTPTVAVYNQTKDEILYRGRIDNMYFRVGKRRTVTTTSELEDALEAIINGNEIAVKETEAVGCFINFKM